MRPKTDLSVLLIVQAGNCFGIGHIKRALQLAQYYKNPFILVISELKDTTKLAYLLKDVPSQIVSFKEKLTNLNIFHNQRIDLIITDCVQVDSHLMHMVNTIEIPVISFDNVALGSCSEVFIAPLPTHTKKSANFTQLYHTPINEKYFAELPPTSISNILISMGGSDPRKTAEKIVKSLKDLPYKITVIAGPLSNYKIEKSPNITVISDVTDLYPYIKSNDLVFCGPGSTLIDSLACSKYVVALPHHQYQMKDLLALDGLYCLPTLFLSANKIRKSIDKATMYTIFKPEEFHFEDFWKNLSMDIVNRPAFCPLCGSFDKTTLLRYTTQNQFTCNTCKSNYVYDIHPPDNQIINADEFIASNPEQQQQGYKKIVINQKEDSHRRIQIIKKILPTPNDYTSYNLLDIGAEYGIFVEEASHNGFSAQGVELSTFSRRLANDNNIQIIDSMSKVYKRGSIYNVITIWKKLELLCNPLGYIKNISSLIPLGGMLALRLPTINQNPLVKGHFKITEKGGQRLVEQAGFKVAKTETYVDINRMHFIELYCIKNR